MYKNLSYLIKHSAIILVILFFVRICFAIAFVPMSIISSNLTVLPRLLFNSLRFDVQVVCYVLLLPTVLTFVFAALRKSWTKRVLSRFRRLYFSIICALLLAISGIDMGFYANFNSHINLTFFDFFNEGPMSLIQTIWEEYHVSTRLSPFFLSFYQSFYLSVELSWASRLLVTLSIRQKDSDFHASKSLNCRLPSYCI